MVPRVQILFMVSSRDDTQPKNHLLTKSQREYLESENLPSNPTIRRKRERIVKRVVGMLADAWLLAESSYLKDREIEKIFDPERGHPASVVSEAYGNTDYEGAGGKDRTFPSSRRQREYIEGSKARRELYEALPGRDPAEAPDEATFFFSNALSDLIAFVSRGVSEVPSVKLEEVIEEGLQKGAAAHGEMVMADVRISSIDTAELLERFSNGDTSKVEEMFLLKHRRDELLAHLAETVPNLKPPSDPQSDPPDWMVERRSEGNLQSAEERDE